MLAILVVEPGKDIQQLLWRQPVAEDMRVDTVQAIDEILERCRHTAYDIIIWDSHVAMANARHGLGLLEALAVESPGTQVLGVAYRDRLELALDSLRSFSPTSQRCTANPCRH